MAGSPMPPTDAAPSVAQYHNRMPVVLDNAQFDDWMRGTPEQAAAMTKPYAGEIEAWRVGPEVGNVRNNRPELMKRVEPALMSGKLARRPSREGDERDLRSRPAAFRYAAAGQDWRP